MTLRFGFLRARVVVLALAASCGHPNPGPPPLAPAPRPVAAAADACMLAPDSAALPATLGIAVPDVARFVQRQVYETLIRLDCRGTPVPELARGWSSDDSGRRWTFTLRPGARFTDSVPLTAADVFASLTRDSTVLNRSAIALEGIDRLSVRFPAAFSGVPPVLADPGLAVGRRTGARDWPVGSGPAIADSTLEGLTITPVVKDRRPTLTVRSSAGGDARDLLDHGIDILVTDDPEVLSYAAGRSDLTTVPLPWDRVYVLLSTTLPEIGDTLRASLARDVVRTDARPAGGSYWWLAGPACPARDSMAAASGSNAPAILYYPQDDPAARGLAERLVALGLIGTGGRAAGIARADLGAHLGIVEGAYVLPLAREALAPCRAVAELAARAPWLPGDPGRYITALVETRARAIVRRGGSAFTVDWDGTLRIR